MTCIPLFVQVDRLEVEMQRYKDKISEIEYLKSRIEELREDNDILVETKNMVEKQLEGSRERYEHLKDLENDLLKAKAEIQKLEIEREDDKGKIDELSEEILALQLSTKSSLSESQSLQAEMQLLKGRKGKIYVTL